MRFLADENVPRASILSLRAAGHDVASIREESRGVSDELILLRAHDEERVILTFDRDYGELIFRRHLPKSAGVVYFRLTTADPVDAARRFIQILETGVLPLAGRFTVVDEILVRSRQLE